MQTIKQAIPSRNISDMARAVCNIVIDSLQQGYAMQAHVDRRYH